METSFEVSRSRIWGRWPYKFLRKRRLIWRRWRWSSIASFYAKISWTLWGLICFFKPFLLRCTWVSWFCALRVFYYAWRLSWENKRHCRWAHVIRRIWVNYIFDFINFWLNVISLNLLSIEFKLDLQTFLEFLRRIRARWLCRGLLQNLIWCATRIVVVRIIIHVVVIVVYGTRMHKLNGHFLQVTMLV